MPETTSNETVYSALLALQAELPTVGKNRTADTGKYKYKYVDLETVQLALFPLFEKHNLVWVTVPTLNAAGVFVLRYSLAHMSGTSIEGDYLLPSGAPQEIGSALTYARRYALCAVTGLAPTGDDSDAAKPRTAAAKAAPVEVVDDVTAAEWIDALNAAETISSLQVVWTAAGKAGATTSPKVIAAKEAAKKALA